MSDSGFFSSGTEQNSWVAVSAKSFANVTGISFLASCASASVNVGGWLQVNFSLTLSFSIASALVVTSMPVDLDVENKKVMGAEIRTLISEVDTMAHQCLATGMTVEGSVNELGARAIAAFTAIDSAIAELTALEAIARNNETLLNSFRAVNSDACLGGVVNKTVVNETKIAASRQKLIGTQNSIAVKHARTGAQYTETAMTKSKQAKFNSITASLGTFT